MRKLENNQGYTLLEMMIVIALLAIAISLSGFGLSTLYSTNIKGKTNELVNEIRLVQTKEMASKTKDYKATISFVDGHYRLRTSVDGTVIKTIDLSSKFKIKKKNASNNFVDLPSTGTEIIFDASSGKATAGAGRYKITTSLGSDPIEFVIVAQNGRVYIDE